MNDIKLLKKMKNDAMLMVGECMLGRQLCDEKEIDIKYIGRLFDQIENDIKKQVTNINALMEEDESK